MKLLLDQSLTHKLPDTLGLLVVRADSHDVPPALHHALSPTQAGLTYLAQALINAACRNDYSASFYRTDMLAAQLAVLQPDNPTRLRFIEQLHNVDVLVLDDFLTTPIDAATAHQIFDILAAREHASSTIVTSQFTPKDWYASIPDAVIAESILNRLVVGAEIITLEGPNMRLEANQ